MKFIKNVNQYKWKKDHESAILVHLKNNLLKSMTTVQGKGDGFDS